MKNPEIERLRALAALIVAFSHLPYRLLPAAFGQSWSNVDLFFVISGFVISNSLFKLLPTNQTSPNFLKRLRLSGPALKTFFTKRFFRIVPLALLWLAIPLGISIAFGDSELFKRPADLFRSALQVITLRFNFIPENTVIHPFAPYWSLMVEEHFYLVLPFLFILFRTRKQRLWLVSAGIALENLVIRPFLPVLNLATADFELHRFTYRKFDALFVGVLIALILENKNKNDFKLPSKSLGYAVVGICLWTVWCFPAVAQSFADGVGMGTIALASGILVFLAALQKGFILEWPVVGPTLTYLGSRSYGIYLIHWPLYRLIVQLIQDGHMGYSDWASVPVYARVGCSLFCLGITFLTAEVCYRLVEAPCIALGHRLTRKWSAPSAATDSLSRASGF